MTQELSLDRLNTSLPQAAAKLAGMPKVTPEVMMIVYLDEIAGRIAELQETISDITREGELTSYSLNITASPTKIPLTCRYFSLHNDGASSIYVFQSKMKPLSRDAEIKISGELKLDFGIVRQRDFYIVCASGGSATIRIFIW